MKMQNSDGLAREDGTPASITHARLSWSDFQLVWVVAQVGRLAHAAEAMAMSHVTLLRKLALIEDRLKARLFDRHRGRYMPTAAGEEIVEAARSMSPWAREAEMRVLGQDLRPSGQVRITAAGIIVGHLLPPVLARFGQDFPEVTLEFLTSRNHLSLARREADVALRVSDQVPDWLIGRKLANVDFKVFGLREPGEQPPRLRPFSALARQARWVSFESDARDLKFDRWLEDHVPDSSVALRVDSFEHALSMLRGGLGVALLPAFLEGRCPELQPLTASIPELRTPLWLITHKELRDTMRIKVVMQALGPALTQAIESGPESHR